MRSAIDIDDELWNILRSYSEVRSRGLQLVQQYGINRNQEMVWRRFRSFVRQAQHYWRAAKLTSYQSSALLYHYSFLNLVKAYLVLRGPDLPDRVHHGLSFDTSRTPSGLSRVKLRVHHSAGKVFELYYRAVFQQAAPDDLNIANLMAHMIDISYQFQSADFGCKSRTYPFISRSVLDEQRGSAWNLLAIPKASQLSYFRTALTPFFEEFEDIAPLQAPNPVINEIFAFESTEWAGYDIYQTKQSREVQMSGFVPMPILHQRLVEAFDGRAAPMYYDDRHSGLFNLPRSRVMVHRMNEEVAIYAAMHFVSEVVRYRPDYLDQLLESAQGWLIESFVLSCPSKFLRAITSRIAGRTFVLSRL